MVKIGLVKQCHLFGCPEDDCTCELVPVMLIPLYDVESDKPHVEGELKFGRTNEIAPWTSRKLNGKLQPVSQDIVIHRPN